MIKEKPDSEFCYETHIFGESKECPDLDTSITLEPKCEKYLKKLTWNVSGHILKCEECQKGR